MTQLDVWKAKTEATKKHIQENGPITTQSFIMPGTTPEMSELLSNPEVGVRMEEGKRVYYYKGKRIDPYAKPASHRKAKVRKATEERTKLSVSARKKDEKPAVERIQKTPPKKAYEVDPAEDLRSDPTDVFVDPATLPSIQDLESLFPVGLSAGENGTCAVGEDCGSDDGKDGEGGKGGKGSAGARGISGKSKSQSKFRNESSGSGRGAKTRPVSYVDFGTPSADHEGFGGSKDSKGFEGSKDSNGFEEFEGFDGFWGGAEKYLAALLCVSDAYAQLPQRGAGAGGQSSQALLPEMSVNKQWDEGTKNGPDRSALLGHNFVYQETKSHGFYSSYFHQRISS